ncbi:MAG: hypothetical protein KKF46_04265 [Nanoarchaeota archaeon]|nr:hypothetical protein [Nanoarchaeota archaeon]MBU1321550.1 hypothetical protein [Nanoarchaeota archaeon]MBU1597084.1 hypothetical protein [Nanoarchaeota archaeon]MBU2441865.1 hypothetical protein [Nanoarchaeota archaeon]
MEEDILPPVAPGEQKAGSDKKKKKGLLGGLFGKKEEKLSAPEQAPETPTPETEKQELLKDVTEDINLDDIRKNLGLEFDDDKKEVPEEIKKEPESEKEEFKLPEIEEPAESEKEEFKLPEIEEPAELKEFEEEMGLDPDKLLEEPPKIEKKKEKTDSSEPFDVNWDSDELKDEKSKKKSDFDVDVKSEVEKEKIKPKEEFIKDLRPEEVKKFAKDLKRKEFEDKKGIKYEPEVNLDEAEDELPPPELMADIPEPPKIEKKKEIPNVKPKKEKKEAKPKKEKKITKKAKTAGIDVDALKKEIEKEFREEFEKERETLKKEKQALEYDKIRVAGQMNKVEFKENTIDNKKEEYRQEKEKLKEEIRLEREQLKNDKEEAKDLIKKLPALKADHFKLNHKMKVIYDKIHEFEEKEKKLLEIEKELENKEIALKVSEKRLEQLDESIREKGFSDYLESEIKSEPLVSTTFEEKDILKASHLELYNLIDTCKVMVRDKNLIEAKKLYMELRNSYEGVNLRGAEKDMLHTVIRELYDDIKLAELEGSGF